MLSTNAHLSLTLHWSYFPGFLESMFMLIWNLLIWPSFGPLDCKCLPHIYWGKSHFIIRPRKSCHCLPLLVLRVIIWLLVFDFLIFREYFKICAAVLLIFQHAMFLRHSHQSASALTLAGLNYQKADIDLKIQDYLKASPSVETIMSFIMATGCMFIVALLF